MTDNEIIKALECCIGNIKCNKCSILGTSNCMNNLMQNALDLINRQRAEIERLKKELMQCKLEKEMLHNTVEEIKSEAIKEFAERLKSYAKELHIGDNISWLVLGVGRVDQLVKEMTEVKENDRA